MDICNIADYFLCIIKVRKYLNYYHVYSVQVMHILYVVQCICKHLSLKVAF